MRRRVALEGPWPIREGNLREARPGCLKRKILGEERCICNTEDMPVKGGAVGRCSVMRFEKMRLHRSHNHQILISNTGFTLPPSESYTGRMLDKSTQADAIFSSTTTWASRPEE